MTLAKAAPADWSVWLANATGQPLEYVRHKLGMTAGNDRLGQIETAPAGAGNTCARGPRHRNTWRFTVTSANPSAHPAPATPLDGCTRCASRNNPAIDARPDGNPDWPGITAIYRCAGCGHNWMTSWAVN